MGSGKELLNSSENHQPPSDIDCLKTYLLVLPSFLLSIEVNKNSGTYWRVSWSEPGRGNCVRPYPGCSRVCPSQTAGGTGGPGPGLRHPEGPGTSACPGSREFHHSLGRASSCCPPQPAPTLFDQRSRSEI